MKSYKNRNKKRYIWLKKYIMEMEKVEIDLIQKL